MQEIEDLKEALTQRSSELERVEQEKKRMSKEHSDVMRTVLSLESDLRRVKRDAEAFGRDLRALKAERDELALKRREENGTAGRVQDQLRSQIRVLEEQLGVQMSKRIALQDQMQAHVCGGYVPILTHSLFFPSVLIVPKAKKVMWLDYDFNITKNARAYSFKSVISKTSSRGSRRSASNLPTKRITFLRSSATWRRGECCSQPSPAP